MTGKPLLQSYLQDSHYLLKKPVSDLTKYIPSGLCVQGLYPVK